MGLVLLALLALPAGESGAQEVLSWFNRGLLPVEFRAGDWVRYAVEEIDEYGPVADTLTVTVVEADTAQAWLMFESPRSVDYVALDVHALLPGENVLGAILRVVRSTEAGLVDEDVAELRESALVQRHFADPFRKPEVRRMALADTTVAGATVPREFVELTELRREPAGPWVVVTRLRASAELSPSIPLTGLLRSRTLSEVTTEPAEAEAEGRGRRRPPLTNETTLVCIGYGDAAGIGLPTGLSTPD